VARHTPFVIRLVDRTVADSTVSPLQVKIDPGSRHSGMAVVATDAHGRVRGLVSVQVDHRGQQITKNMKARAAFRRRRRAANLRYRQPRFDNRRKPAGWLPPSLRHRVDGTVSMVHRLRRWAPVTSVQMELVRFDTQLMDNSETAGVGYQQGTLSGFEVREYLLEKYRHRCVYCDATGMPLNIDHVRPRSKGGSGRVSNLVLACISCNQKKGNRPVEEFLAHAPTRLARILAQLKRPLDDAAAVNAIRWALKTALEATGLPVTCWSGGRTKWNRTRLSLPKTDTLDAICIGKLEAVSGIRSR
jgi:5-methylcytosine-specific restriction endonuclease McrA